MRQLWWMAEARARDEWDRTGAILSLMFNVNRDSKKTKPTTPIDFNPFRRGEKPPAPASPTVYPLSAFKQMIINLNPAALASQQAARTSK